MRIDELIGAKLRALRIEKGLTQEKIAKQLNTDRSCISRIEGGRLSITHGKLLAYCSLLDISLSDLYKEIEETI